MRTTIRRSRGVPEGESYYISMTDMMVGVLFVFIIMLSYFAMQFRASTASLLKAKDAQTPALLRVATTLEREDVSLEIDRQHRVVCIPGSALGGAVGSGPGDRHCFAYSAALETKVEKAAQVAGQARAKFVAFVSADLDSAKLPMTTSAEGGSLTFPADKLFLPNSATLSPEGQSISTQVADTLAQRLPCYGYGAPVQGPCADATKMSVVNVTGQTGFDAFSDAGRQAAALSIQRAAAFHQALTAAQPVLGQIRNAPEPNAQPLLRVAAFGQSEAKAPPAGAGSTISIQFNMAQ